MRVRPSGLGSNSPRLIYFACSSPYTFENVPEGSSVTFFARNPLNIVVPKTGAEKWLTQLCLGNVQKFLVATSSNKLCHWKSIGACDFTHIDRHFSTHLRRVCRSLDRLGGIMLMELPVSRWLYVRCRISLGKCA